MLRTNLGAVLGFFCSHEYAHTYGSPPQRIPRSLKGVDMAIYAVFRALGLRIEILPVMEGMYGSRQLSFGGVNRNHNSEYQPFVHFLQWFNHQQWSGRRAGDMAPTPTVDDVELTYEGYTTDDEFDNGGSPEVADLEDYKDVHTRLQTILRTRQIKGTATAPEPVMTGTKLHEQIDDTDRDKDECTAKVCVPDQSVCK